MIRIKKSISREQELLNCLAELIVDEGLKDISSSGVKQLFKVNGDVRNKTEKLNGAVFMVDLGAQELKFNMDLLESALTKINRRGEIVVGDKISPCEYIALITSLAGEKKYAYDEYGYMLERDEKIDIYLKQKYYCKVINYGNTIEEFSNAIIKEYKIKRTKDVIEQVIVKDHPFRIGNLSPKDLRIKMQNQLARLTENLLKRLKELETEWESLDLNSIIRDNILKTILEFPVPDPISKRYSNIMPLIEDKLLSKQLILDFFSKELESIKPTEYVSNYSDKSGDSIVAGYSLNNRLDVHLKAYFYVNLESYFQGDTLMSNKLEINKKAIDDIKVILKGEDGIFHKGELSLKIEGVTDESATKYYDNTSIEKQNRLLVLRESKTLDIDYNGRSSILLPVKKVLEIICDTPRYFSEVLRFGLYYEIKELEVSPMIGQIKNLFDTMVEHKVAEFIKSGAIVKSNGIVASDLLETHTLGLLYDKLVWIHNTKKPRNLNDKFFEYKEDYSRDDEPLYYLYFSDYASAVLKDNPSKDDNKFSYDDGVLIGDKNKLVEIEEKNGSTLFAINDEDSFNYEANLRIGLLDSKFQRHLLKFGITSKNLENYFLFKEARTKMLEQLYTKRNVISNIIQIAKANSSKVCKIFEKSSEEKRNAWNEFKEKMNSKTKALEATKELVSKLNGISTTLTYAEFKEEIEKIGISWEIEELFIFLFKSDLIRTVIEVLSTNLTAEEESAILISSSVVIEDHKLGSITYGGKRLDDLFNSVQDLIKELVTSLYLSKKFMVYGGAKVLNTDNFKDNKISDSYILRMLSNKEVPPTAIITKVGSDMKAELYRNLHHKLSRNLEEDSVVDKNITDLEKEMKDLSTFDMNTINLDELTNSNAKLARLMAIEQKLDYYNSIKEADTTNLEVDREKMAIYRLSTSYRNKDYYKKLTRLVLSNSNVSDQFRILLDDDDISDVAHLPYIAPSDLSNEKYVNSEEPYWAYIKDNLNSPGLALIASNYKLDKDDSIEQIKAKLQINSNRNQISCILMGLHRNLIFMSVCNMILFLGKITAIPVSLDDSIVIKELNKLQLELK